MKVQSKLLWLLLGFCLPMLWHYWQSQLQLVAKDSVLPLAPDSSMVCFTPGAVCSDVITEALSKAQRTIYVQAYSFTHAGIAKALVQAQRRGVAVSVILDKSNLEDRYSKLSFLLRAGIKVYIDPITGIAHNKVMILDETTVITGSFNFSKAADARNAENVLILHQPLLAAQYLRNWQERGRLSKGVVLD
jgi:phospholipase D